MQAIEQFDPTATTGGELNVHLPNGGWIAIMNESVVGLQLIFGDGSTRIIPPFFLRVMRVTSNQLQAQWSQFYIITGGQAPQGLNIVTGECYDPAEWTQGELMISLPRMVNVGNSTGSGTLAQLVNDGAAVGTQIIEATALGSPGSNVRVLNDGTIAITVLSNGAQALVLSIIPGTVSTPATVLLHGIADKANAVPATGVTAGALPAGVTIPAGQVTGAIPASTVPASGVTAGTLPASVHETQIFSDGGDITSDGAGNMTMSGILGAFRSIIGTDTTAANKVVYEATDSHSGSDWDLILTQAGGYTLWDNIHGRNLWTANADGSLSLPGSASISAAGVYQGSITGNAPTASSASVATKAETVDTVRNGTATPVHVYTGANTPAGDGITTPETGAVWVQK